MRFSLIPTCVLSAIALTLFTGCGIKGPITGRADPYFPEQIHPTDDDLANKTAFSTPLMERRNGLLYVTVPVRSTVNHDLHIDYRVTWFDELGTPIDGGMGNWMGGTTLAARTPQYIRFNSTSANAANFQMDVRWAQ